MILLDLQEMVASPQGPELPHQLSQGPIRHRGPQFLFPKGMISDAVGHL